MCEEFDVLSTLPAPDLSIFAPVFVFCCLGVPGGGRRAVERIRALSPPSGPILRVEMCPPPWSFHCERRRAVGLAAVALTLPERPSGLPPILLGNGLACADPSAEGGPRPLGAP